MSLGEFLKQYRSMLIAIFVVVMAVILFFVCLGTSRKMGLNQTESSGLVVLETQPAETGEAAASAAENETTAGADVPAETTTAGAAEPATAASIITAADGTVFTVTSANGVTTAGVNVRSLPSTDGEILEVYPEGTAVKVTGTSTNGWTQIDYEGGAAYISSEYVTIR